MFNSDPEMDAFEALILRSLDEAQRGEFAAVHTPEMILARRGRPVGSTKANARKAISLRLEPSTLDAWRASGKGWQTRAAALLAQHAP